MTANMIEAERSRNLWCAVLQRTIEDATSTPNNKKPNSELMRCRDAARAWLTSNSKDFRSVCHMAGTNPDAVFDRMLLLDQRGWPAPPKKTGPSERSRRRRLELQRVAR